MAMLHLPLNDDDCVVAAFPLRDFIVIVTKTGKLFRVAWSLEYDDLTFLE